MSKKPQFKILIYTNIEAIIKDINLICNIKKAFNYLKYIFIKIIIF